MINTIMFDLGDVLENSEDITNNIQLIQDRVLERFGVKKIARKKIHKYRTELVKLIGKRPFENRYFYWRDLLELCDVGPSRMDVFRVYDLFIDEYAKYVKIFDDVKPTLKQLSIMDIRMTIVSNNTLKRAEEFLLKFNINGYFSDVVISELVGSPKPWPLIFKYALFRMKRKPKDVMYVGNRVDNDVIGAQNVDIKPVLLRRDLASKVEQLPCQIRIINTLKELPSLLVESHRK